MNNNHYKLMAEALLSAQRCASHQLCAQCLDTWQQSPGFRALSAQPGADRSGPHMLQYGQPETL